MAELPFIPENITVHTFFVKKASDILHSGVNVYSRNWLALDGLWFQSVERESGMDAAMRGGSERARLALDVLKTHVLRYIGAYAMELGGLDALAFTGGIGENYAPLRAGIMEAMAHLGVIADADSNENGRGERLISAPGSVVEVHVIPADEELMVVNAAYELIKDK